MGSSKDLLRHLPRPLYTCEAVLTEVAHFLGNPEPVLAAVADGLPHAIENQSRHSTSDIIAALVSACR